MAPARTATCAAMAASASAYIAAAASAEPATTTTKPPKVTQTAAAPKSLGEMVLGLCTRGRHVFLTGSIDDESAKVVIAQLMFLEQEAPGVPIRLHISSGGGKVQPGFAIHDVMHSITSPVHTICLGHCESMAAVLLAERTGKPLDEVLDLIEYDHVMDAQEALALGLIDIVITKPGEGFMVVATESAAAEPTSSPVDAS